MNFETSYEHSFRCERRRAIFKQQIHDRGIFRLAAVQPNELKPDWSVCPKPCLIRRECQPAVRVKAPKITSNGFMS
jgi:hypothetical protein